MCATLMIVVKGLYIQLQGIMSLFLSRFKVKVQVEDISDDVPIILFHPLADEIIEKVVLKSAYQLLQENTILVCINNFYFAYIFLSLHLILIFLVILI
ncbi:hypothetical protein Hanom_Chr16g01464141 [Helianthus anomalus]